MTRLLGKWCLVCHVVCDLTLKYSGAPDLGWEELPRGTASTTFCLQERIPWAGSLVTSSCQQCLFSSLAPLGDTDLPVESLSPSWQWANGLGRLSTCALQAESQGKKPRCPCPDVALGAGHWLVTSSRSYEIQTPHRSLLPISPNPEAKSQPWPQVPGVSWSQEPGTEVGAEAPGLRFSVRSPGSPSGQSLTRSYRLLLRATFMGRGLGQD